MILKGNQRGHGRELAMHLLNVEDNEHAVVHLLRGFIQDDLAAAFKEVEAVSLGTKCQQYLFSLSLNPPQTEKVSVDQFESAIKKIEQRLGLVGQPCAIVFHEKKGRRHAHCVWSRIDAAQMKAINLSHYKLRLQDISRELFREHEWDLPAGLIDQNDRDPLNFTHEEAGQSKRVQRDPKKLKRLFKDCWEGSDSKGAFANALVEHGLCLAHGDRRGFVAVDASGEVYSVSRWVGIKAKAVRAKIGMPDSLPTVAQAVEFLSYAPSEHSVLPQQNSALFENKHATLVARQRTERSALMASQAKRKIVEITKRTESLPKGMSAIWAKLNGSYSRLITELELDAGLSAQRDMAEQQALIDRHLSERGLLDRKSVQRDIKGQLNALFAQSYDVDPRQHLLLPKDRANFTLGELTKNPALILDHLSNKSASFTDTEIKRALAEFVRDPISLRHAIDLTMKSDQLVKQNGSSFTTLDYLNAQNRLDNTVKRMSSRRGVAVSKLNLKSAIKAQDAKMREEFGGQLSEEQSDALSHILSGHQLINVVGLAGSGKSTMLAAAKTALTLQGTKVHGAALAGKAADELFKSSAIESRTLASLEASWKAGYEPIKSGEVLIIDEAGMIGTRQLMRVAQKIEEIGAGLVLIGDPRQLQPIEAGTPFKGIVETQDAARLTKIHRQKEDWQREASAQLASGNVADGVASYEAKGCVKIQPNRHAALASLVEDYMTDYESNGDDVSRLAFAHRRKDVFALNQAIRGALRSNLPVASELLVETDLGPRVIAKGDRIVVTRNDKSLGVKNGMLGTVSAIGDNQVSVDLDGSGQCQRVTFDPKRFASFDHGYAVTIHKSQGVTVDQSYVLGSRTMDDSLTYVAMTRHRKGMKLVFDKTDQPPQIQSKIHAESSEIGFSKARLDRKYNLH